MSLKRDLNLKHVFGFILFILLILFLHCTYQISTYERRVQELQTSVDSLPDIVTALEQKTNSDLKRWWKAVGKIRSLAKKNTMRISELEKENERLSGELEEPKNELEDLKVNK